MATFLGSGVVVRDTVEAGSTFTANGETYRVTSIQSPTQAYASNVSAKPGEYVAIYDNNNYNTYGQFVTAVKVPTSSGYTPVMEDKHYDTLCYTHYNSIRDSESYPPKTLLHTVDTDPKPEKSFSEMREDYFETARSVMPIFFFKRSFNEFTAVTSEEGDNIKSYYFNENIYDMTSTEQIKKVDHIFKKTKINSFLPLLFVAKSVDIPVFAKDNKYNSTEKSYLYKTHEVRNQSNGDCIVKTNISDILYYNHEEKSIFKIGSTGGMSHIMDARNNKMIYYDGSDLIKKRVASYRKK